MIRDMLQKLCVSVCEGWTLFSAISSVRVYHRHNHFQQIEPHIDSGAVQLLYEDTDPKINPQ